MKICIDERTYEGSGEEIMEQLRQQTFDYYSIRICSFHTAFVRSAE